MHISYNWLKEFVAIEATPEELAERLTMLGLEIEAAVSPGKDINEVYVGHILDIQPHPDADKLVVCQTDVGQGAPLQIVCGATNMKAGDKVPTAIDGAILPGGFKIGRRKMRGIQSCGMMCSARELSLGEDHAGLMILNPDTPTGEDIKKTLGLDDVVFEIEVTPNRGDWASMIGVARELAAYYALDLRIPPIILHESGHAANTLSSVTIDAPDLCPRYAGRILRNIVIKPSPPWMCARLMAAGQRPINNVVDITNYVLLETGHPLHAFDYEKLKENRIVVRRARTGETITTLDDEKRSLEEDMLVIADAELPQAVAGIMGGADSEVDETSRHVFLESAWFLPRSVRSTARRLGLLTEAAQHFQRGADIEMAVYALDRAAMLMQELAEAEIAPGILDAFPAPPKSVSVPLRFNRTAELLGVDITTEKQTAVLSGLGFTTEQMDATGCSVQIPSWRHDVSHESDLIEEVARHFGYDNIPTTVPPVRQSEMVFSPEDKRIRTLRRFLAAQGLAEVMNWSFGNPENESAAGVNRPEAQMVMLENPLSEKQAGMRTSLLPGLYANAAYNHRRGARSVALFELGPVFHAVEGENLAREPMRLGILLSGLAPNHWSVPERHVDFYDIKGYAETLERYFKRAFTLEKTDHKALQEGLGVAVNLRKNFLGIMGKPALSTQKHFDLPEQTFVIEIDLDALIARPTAAAQFEDIPQFPASLRDLAVVVSHDTPAETLVKTVRSAGGALLKEINIFDVYTGKPLPADKKSIALSLIFQSPERTLRDKDTQKSLDRIIQQLQQQCGAELR